MSTSRKIDSILNRLFLAIEELTIQADEDCPQNARTSHFNDALDEAREAIEEAKKFLT